MKNSSNKDIKNNWAIPRDSLVELNMDLIIPDNISLTIEEGVKLKIKGGKSIILNGDLKINGTKSNPVIFQSSDSNQWGGLFVGSRNNNKSKVIINSAIFKNFGSFPKTKMNNMMLNGGLTFYKTNLIINNVLIENAFSEDAINAINSQARISKLNIKNSISDAIIFIMLKLTI